MNGPVKEVVKLGFELICVWLQSPHLLSCICFWVLPLTVKRQRWAFPWATWTGSHSDP